MSAIIITSRFKVKDFTWRHYIQLTTPWTRHTITKIALSYQLSALVLCIIAIPREKNVSSKKRNKGKVRKAKKEVRPMMVGCNISRSDKIKLSRCSSSSAINLWMRVENAAMDAPLSFSAAWLSLLNTSGRSAMRWVICSLWMSWWLHDHANLDRR